MPSMLRSAQSKGRAGRHMHSVAGGRLAGMGGGGWEGLAEMAARVTGRLACLALHNSV